MTAKKTPSTTASKSTKLTDAPQSTVSTLNPDNYMKSDNSINPINAVNSDNTVNSTTPVNKDNLFGNEQTTTETTAATDTTQFAEQPKQQRVGKQQSKSDFTDFKETYLMPSKLMKRHSVNIEESVWEQLERIARILGERGANVGSYINAILSEHLKIYASDIEVWRKL